MNENDLRKLSRQELLELLVEQSKRIDELKIELAETKEQLNTRQVAISESGNLAEAALKINGFFDAAQKASQFYIDQARLYADMSKREYERLGKLGISTDSVFGEIFDASGNSKNENFEQINKPVSTEQLPEHNCSPKKRN